MLICSANALVVAERFPTQFPKSVQAGPCVSSSADPEDNKRENEYKEDFFYIGKCQVFIYIFLHEYAHGVIMLNKPN